MSRVATLVIGTPGLLDTIYSMYDPQEHPGSKIPYILLLTGTHNFLIQNIHITTHRNTRVPRYHIYYCSQEALFRGYEIYYYVQEHLGPWIPYITAQRDT